MNHYQELEVAENASPEVLKAAYRSLMQRFHPDRNPGDADASARAVRLTQAYETLSDPARRAAYDAEIRKRRGVPGDSTARGEPGAALGARNSRRNSAVWTALSTSVLVLFFAWMAWPTVFPKAKGPGIDSSVPVAAKAIVMAGVPAAPGVTMPEFARNLRIELKPVAPSGSPALPGPRLVLVIPTIELVVGNFDADRYVAFVTRNREDIVQGVADRLSIVAPGTLAGLDGESRLRRLIVDAIADIIGGRSRDGSALPQSAAAPYGAIDALVPDGFSIEPKSADGATMPR